MDDQTEVAEPPARTAETPQRHSWAFVEMLVSSALGLWASLVLSADAVVLAANPTATLSCDVSAKISCTTVGLAWQSSLLGFPNAFLGLITEPIVITVAIACLSGVRFPRWFMLTAQSFYAIGFVFAYWLFFQAYFVIGALCPWCLLITVTTTLVFFSMTRVNIMEGNFGGAVRRRLAYPMRLGADVALSVILVALLAGAIIYRYL